MTSICIILKHTGSYSDYRAVPIAYTSDASGAEDFISKATAAADNMRSTKRALEEKIDAIDTEQVGYKRYDRLTRKIESLKSDVDMTLSASDVDNDLEYSFQIIKRYGA